MTLFVLLILAVFASEKNTNGTANGAENEEKIGNNEENSIVVKIEEDEYFKKKSKFIGVSYHKNTSKWKAQRWSRNDNNMTFNGCYDDEETAAHASDTLARKLMKNGKQKLKLNFPDDYTEVQPEKRRFTSKFIGVWHDKNKSKWRVQRRSKNDNTMFSYGYYDDEEAAAHASDTLARNLMEKDEQKHKLNFPEDHTEVYRKEKKSKYIGTYSKFYAQSATYSKWCAQRWSKHENRVVTNGYYDDEETAAHASDTLARKLMKNAERGHKLNFPDDFTEVLQEEKDITSKFIGVSYKKDISKWYVQRHSKNGSKNVSYGCFDSEETAAHASDTLARKLMKNGEQKLKLNFPDDHTETSPEENQKKRNRKKEITLEHPQNN